jgi:hypothetical protein
MRSRYEVVQEYKVIALRMLTARLLKAPNTACRRLASRAEFQRLRVRFIVLRGVKVSVAAGRRLMLTLGGQHMEPELSPA